MLLEILRTMIKRVFLKPEKSEDFRINPKMVGLVYHAKHDA